MTLLQIRNGKIRYLIKKLKQILHLITANRTDKNNYAHFVRIAYPHEYRFSTERKSDISHETN